MATKKAAPSRSGVKTSLTDFDRAGFLGRMQDLYANYEGYPNLPTPRSELDTACACDIAVTS